MARSFPDVSFGINKRDAATISIPLIIIITKSDRLENLMKEHAFSSEHFDYIQQTLRNIALKNNATLVYTSSSENKNISLLLDIYAAYLFKGVVGPLPCVSEAPAQPTTSDGDAAVVVPLIEKKSTGLKPFQPQVSTNKDVQSSLLFIPYGWDTAGKVSVLTENSHLLKKQKADATYETIIHRPLKDGAAGPGGDGIEEKIDDEKFMAEMLAAQQHMAEQDGSKLDQLRKRRPTATPAKSTGGGTPNPDADQQPNAPGTPGAPGPSGADAQSGTPAAGDKPKSKDQVFFSAIFQNLVNKKEGSSSSAPGTASTSASRSARDMDTSDMEKELHRVREKI